VSRPRFLADHDLHGSIVKGVLLAAPEAEFYRAQDLGLSKHADAELLTIAAQAGMIVVSHDVNTMRAQAYARIVSGQPMSGLLLAHQWDAIGPVIEALLLVWHAADADEWNDRVEFLPF